MAGPLAIPTFRSKPDDKLAAVDVYKKSDSAVVNNIKDVLSSPVNTKGLLDSLRGGKAAYGTILAKTNLVNAATKGLATDATSALNRLGMTGAAKALSSITPALTAVITTKLNGGNISNLKATVTNAAGNLARVAVGNLGNLGSINSTLTTWTGKAGLNLNDNAATGALASALVTGGLNNGTSGVLTALSSKLNTSSLTRAVVKDIMPTVNKTGSISGLKEVNGFAPGLLPTLSKDPIADFSCAYPKPEFPLTNDQYQANYTEMKSVFNEINPGWTTSSRVVDDGFDANGMPLTRVDSAFSMSSISGATDEFKKTVTMGATVSTDPQDKLMLVAAKYSGTDTTAQAQNLYPAAFVNSAGSNASSPDPRSVAVSEAAQVAPPVAASPIKTVRPPGTIEKEMKSWVKIRDEKNQKEVEPKWKAAQDWKASHGEDDQYLRLMGDYQWAKMNLAPIENNIYNLKKEFDEAVAEYDKTTIT